MNKYKYIGYYNDNADIKDIIENKGWNNPDEVASYLEDGYGKFYHDDANDETHMCISDVNNKDIFVSSNNKYIIKFSEGHYVALDEDDHYSVNAGFYIDIWEYEDEGDKTLDLSTEALKNMSAKRHIEDRAIKCAIKDEFKARFKNPGEGLNFYENADMYAYGMLDATGEIGKMFLAGDGEIKVTIVQEYEDAVEDFESRYFACDDWPLLLMLVRKGIEEEWLIEDEED